MGMGGPGVPRLEGRSPTSKGAGEVVQRGAAGIASDVRKQGLLRGLFIHLAWRHGWRQPALLARICGMGPRAVHLALSQAPPAGLEAAAASSSSAVDDAEARSESSLRV